MELPHPSQNGFGPPMGHPLPPQSHLQQPPYQKRKGKRGKRGGSGLEARQRAFKRQAQTQQLGFFGQVPSLQDLRQENWRRTQQHFGGPSRPFPQHGPGGGGGGRSSNFRRARKVPKQPKFPQPTPRPVPLTPSAANPLDTPANVGKAQVAPGGVDKLEAEGLQAGLDWYGTNENTALFLGGHPLTTSDSEDLEEGEGEGEVDEEASEGEGEAHSLDASGGGGSGRGGNAETAAADVPRHLKARLVEQEAYIAELEDQNLRLREQLEMLQQEVEELRGNQRAPLDSEEGFAEHSEGSLPGDLSVVQHPQQQQQHVRHLQQQQHHHHQRYHGELEPQHSQQQQHFHVEPQQYPQPQPQHG